MTSDTAKPLEKDDVVFLYGALRSGTTVFRLMLNGHAQIDNPGEVDCLFDHLQPSPDHPTGWRYDKAGLRTDRIFLARALQIPDHLDGLDLLADFLAQFRARAPGKTLSLNVHRHVDRILAVLPKARFIHMLRDPRDVARSSIAMGWAGTLYHGVHHWLKTEHAWESTTAHLTSDQTMQLRYEDLFQQINPQLRRVTDFLGLPFDADMLRYHENTSYGPPDPSLVHQWRRKSDPKDVANLETRAADLMVKRGYALSADVRPIGPLPRLALALRNKLAIWSFGLRRFGPIIFLGEKLTRQIGLRGPHARIRERMRSIQTAHLK